MVIDAKKILAESDAILGKIINIIPEPCIKSTNEVFHDLMSCLLEQQIHYRSTKKIFQKMLDAASLKILTIDNFRQFEEKGISTVKLSMAKYETVARIIEFWEKNKINWQLLNDNEVTEKLSSVKGIGKWTIDMILLYTLQRPCVFPYDDFHLKQIMISLYGLNPNSKLKAQMIDISNDWGGYKSPAVKYLLAWKEYNKKSSATKNQN
jgi:DNA-3-methyladenine glycosylase II